MTVATATKPTAALKDLTLGPPELEGDDLQVSSSRERKAGRRVADLRLGYPRGAEAVSGWSSSASRGRRAQALRDFMASETS